VHVRRSRSGGRVCEQWIAEAVKGRRVKATGPKQLVHVRELAQLGKVKATRGERGGECGPRVGEEREELG
jgi:hypothetical protein